MQRITDVIDALSLLTPCEVPSVRKVRIGNPAGDGGYVLADRFWPGQSVYSYGISTEMSFDLDLANRGLQLFLYDHTIASLPRVHSRISFRPEGISGENRPAESLFRLDHHIAANNHAAKADMILKMDVESTEWDVLDHLNAAQLSQFEQIVVELHKLGELKDFEFRHRFVRCLRKLTEQFHLVHVHANNVATIKNVAGFPVPGTLEVTFLRKDIGEAVPWRSFVPSALDFPNTYKQPDHVLGFFPFLPMALSARDLKAGLLCAGRNARGLVDRLQADTPVEPAEV